jgi:hypothetical protein
LIIQTLSRIYPPTGKKLKIGFHRESVLGLLLFILYINNLPKVASRNTSITLYADDTSVLVTHYDNAEFKIAMNKIFQDINEWFKCYLLSLNFNKTHALEFKSRNDMVVDTIVSYDNYFISNINSLKFLRLTIDTSLTWEHHINKILAKMNLVCFALRSIKTVVSQKTIRMIYFACAHSVMNYGIIFWGNSRNSIKVFKLQKKMVRIMTNSGSKDSYRDLFKKWKFFPFIHNVYIPC